MAIKLNAKQHKFVLNLLLGMSQTEAYIQAGYAPKGARHNASRLITKDNILTAYRQLQEKATSEAVLAVIEKKERLSQIARACLVDFIEDGQPVLRKDVPNNAAVKEFYHQTRYDRKGNPITTTAIKLNDPIEAIRELNRIEGSHAPSKHVVGQRVRFDINVVSRGKNMPQRLPGA